jgi:cell division protein FtsN
MGRLRAKTSMRNVIFLLIALNCAYFTWQAILNVPDKPVERSPPPLPPDVRRLVTLKERDARQPPPETRNIEDLTATQPPSAVLPLTCQALGPFLAESELKSIEKRLDRPGLTTRPQTRYQREQVGYTVLLQPVDYEQALQIKRKLEKENITASFIGTGNTLSLGAFRDKSQAELTLTRAQALGLDPRIEPGYAKRSTYWLIIQGRDRQDESLSELTREYSGLRVEDMVCP